MLQSIFGPSLELVSFRIWIVCWLNSCVHYTVFALRVPQTSCAYCCLHRLSGALGALTLMLSHTLKVLVILEQGTHIFILHWILQIMHWS